MTIRLLDPPLHEFLPEGDLQDIVNELTKETGVTEDEVYSRIENLSEVNPMLGFRGCRSDDPPRLLKFPNCSTIILQIPEEQIVLFFFLNGTNICY